MRDTDAVMQLGAYDTNVNSELYAVKCEDPSLTVQSQSEDADINTIVRRFGITGQLPVNLRAPLLEDYTEIFDFQSAQNVIVEARETFMELPAEVRSKFDNNPQKFLEFCTASKDGRKLDNLDEMRKMGLAVPEVVVPAEKVVKVEVVNERSGGVDQNVGAASGASGKGDR